MTASQASSDRFRAVFERAVDGIVLLEGKTLQILEANPRFAILAGSGRDELIGRCILEFVVPNIGQEMRIFFSDVLESGGGARSCTLIRSDADPIDVEITAGTLREGGELSVLAFIRDVTERNRFQEQLTRQEKISTLGVLSAGLMHEFGNPLMGVYATLQNVVQEEPEPRIRDRLKAAIVELDRMNRLLQEMHQFSAAPSRQRKNTSINAIIRRVVRFIRFDRRSKNVRIRLQLARDIRPVALVEDGLVQVLMNLLLNAFDALVDHPKPEIWIRTSLCKTGQIMLEVEDNGPGIPVDQREGIFKPFVTTKSAQRGTGLGLSISRDIIEDEHRGKLYLDESAAGARFIMEIPAVRI